MPRPVVPGAVLGDPRELSKVGCVFILFRAILVYFHGLGWTSGYRGPEAWLVWPPPLGSRSSGQWWIEPSTLTEPTVCDCMCQWHSCARSAASQVFGTVKCRSMFCRCSASQGGLRPTLLLKELTCCTLRAPETKLKIRIWWPHTKRGPIHGGPD